MATDPVILFREGPTEVVYYASENRSQWRTAPSLVCKAVVVRVTTTQLLVQVPGSENVERFRRDDGRLVGGSYGAAKVKPVTEKAMSEMADSARRRRVHRGIETVSSATLKLDQLRPDLMPIARVERLELLLRDAHKALEAVLEASKEKCP